MNISNLYTYQNGYPIAKWKLMSSFHTISHTSVNQQIKLSFVFFSENKRKTSSLYLISFITVRKDIKINRYMKHFSHITICFVFCEPYFRYSSAIF